MLRPLRVHDGEAPLGAPEDDGAPSPPPLATPPVSEEEEVLRLSGPGPWEVSSAAAFKSEGPGPPRPRNMYCARSDCDGRWVYAPTGYSPSLE